MLIVTTAYNLHVHKTNVIMYCEPTIVVIYSPACLCMSEDGELAVTPSLWRRGNCVIHLQLHLAMISYYLILPILIY